MTDKEEFDAYWDQTEHPDSTLIKRTCDSCSDLHLNDPLVSPAWCPPCLLAHMLDGTE